MSSSQSTDDVAIFRRKVAKLETARKIERVERMVRDLQAAIISKMKNLEQKVEKKDLEQKMERMQAQATSDKKDLEQKMEKKDLEQQMETNEREQQIKRMEADNIMRSENEKRDRLLENEKRDRLLENEKRDREADKKETQHQIDQLKWEARFSQMEQQQAARAYNIQPLPNPRQYNAGTVLPLAPQKERAVQLQPAPLQELRLRGGERGPSHSMTPVTAMQPVLPGSTAISAALPSAAQPSAALPSVAASRMQAASASQPVQHQHQSICNTPAASRPLQQQVQQQQGPQQPQQQQHQVTAGPAARAGPVPLPANARTHFFLSHCQGTGGDQTNAIYLELKQLGFSCW
jgi:hypothetical protein